MKPDSVILLSLEWTRPGDPPIGLGIASIAASLRAVSVEPIIIADAVNRPGFCADQFTARVLDVIEKSGTVPLVGIGAYVWNEPEIQQLLVHLKAKSNAKIVIGGPQISYCGKGLLEGFYPDADYFVRGHGETAMVSLALGHASSGTDGLHCGGTPDLMSRAILELDHLPSPHLDGTLPVGDFVRLETQRGCPFRCTFCQHREAGRWTPKKDFVENRWLAELGAFKGAGVKRLTVLDPIFNANPAHAIRFLEEARKMRLTAHLSLQCRFEMLDEPFLDAMAGLNVTLEFGLQTAIEHESVAIRRRNNLQKAAVAIDRLHARAIPFEVSLIYGLPLQTLESFRASVQWCLDQRVPRVRAWPLLLLRGTELYDQRARWGFQESQGDRIPMVIAAASFTRAEHAEMANLAAWLDRNPGATSLPGALKAA